MTAPHSKTGQKLYFWAAHAQISNMVFKFLFGIHLLQCLHCKKNSYTTAHTISSTCTDIIGVALGLKTHFPDFSCFFFSSLLSIILKELVGRNCLNIISFLVISCFILITYIFDQLVTL